MIDNKKEAVIDALVCTTTITEASKKTGVARSTIYKYMKEPEFIEEYTNRRNILLQESCNALQNNMIEAIENLVTIYKDIGNSSQVRLNAIDMLLRHCYRMTMQCDILNRIEEIERSYIDNE